MYFVDTPTRQIQTFDYDQITGTPENRRALLETASDGGWPDDPITDSEGCIWSAEWDGGRVVYARWQIRPRCEGYLSDERRVLPFGGPDFKTLCITSVWDRISGDERRVWPLSGNLFAIDVDVAGLPDTEYLGYLRCSGMNCQGIRAVPRLVLKSTACMKLLREGEAVCLHPYSK